MLNFMLNVWLTISFVILAGVFFGSWWYCVVEYGYLLGLGFGWMPSALAAVLVALLWPIAIIIIDVYISGSIIISNYKGGLESVLLFHVIFLAIFASVLFIVDRIEARKARNYVQDHIFTKKLGFDSLHAAVKQEYSAVYEFEFVNAVMAEARALREDFKQEPSSTAS